MMKRLALSIGLLLLSGSVPTRDSVGRILGADMSIVALVTLTSAAIVGAGSAPIRPSPVSPAAQASTLEACKAFTLEEVAKAVGRTFRRARPGSAPGATTCDFIGGSEGSINVSISLSSSKKEFDEMRKLFVENGQPVEPVSGVGDDAYWTDARIYVRVGDKWLVIWNGDSSQPVARARSEVLAVAKLGVPKLR